MTLEKDPNTLTELEIEIYLFHNIPPNCSYVGIFKSIKYEFY